MHSELFQEQKIDKFSSMAKNQHEPQGGLWVGFSVLLRGNLMELM